MKKTSIILSIVALIVFTISCTKETAEDIAPLVTTASMSASVDGNDWTSITRVTKHYSNLNSFVITGTSTNGEIMVVTVKGDVVGTYTSSASIDSASAQVGVVWKPSTSLNYVSKGGTVNITEINTSETRISGTFNFELVNSSDLNDVFNITSGKFENVKYSVSDSSKVAVY